MTATQTDVLIIGGGIIGLATAYQLTRRSPQFRVTVLEKEPRVAAHQTGRNSGVLHSGIYYRPGSLRAQNCRAGKEELVKFCEEEGVDFEICGKVIVAVSDEELPRLDSIYERGQANGVRCEIIGRERLAEIEPHTAGMRAIHVPDAGIVNYRQVCERLAGHIRQAGGELVFDARVTKLAPTAGEVAVETTAGDYVARHAINCAGLHSDRIARLGGTKPNAKIVPFRGEFYELKPESRYLCRNLIYPVPDPRFPFLGVHFTRMTDGSVECGPNAVLAFAREGYRKRDVNLRDLAEALSYPGFLRLARRNWRMGMGEMWRSISKQAFVKALQRLTPAITAEQLLPGRSGVRAQALAPDGNLVDDFLIIHEGRVVNVCNAPSPAATACLSIGRIIVDQLAPTFA